MLDVLLLILFLILVFRVVVGGLRQEPSVGSAGAMGDHGNVITINKAAEWEAKLDEAATQKKVVLVDFTATWCGPCRQMAPHFVELSKKHTDIIFLKVDVDQFPEISGKWEVQAMPTFLFIHDKKAVHRIVGANKDELVKKTVEFSHVPAHANA